MLYSRYHARWDRIYRDSGKRLIYIHDKQNPGDGYGYVMWEMTQLGFTHHSSTPDPSHCGYASWSDWMHCKMEVTVT